MRDHATVAPEGPGWLVTLQGPTALRAAVRRAREQHPYAASGEIALDVPAVANDAELLWRRLTDLQGAEREQAIARLAPHEWRLLAVTAQSRLVDRTVREILGLVLRQHSLPDAALLAWRTLLVGDGDQPSLRELAVPAVQTAGKARDVWERLLRAQSPVVALIEMWMHPARHVRSSVMPKSFDEWVAIPAVGLERFPLFLDVVRRALLDAKYLRALDKQEDSATIANWVARLVPAGERPTWYLTYLSETCPGLRNGCSGPHWRWPVGHAVCEVIYQSIGAPEDGNPFWEAASAEVVEAFELWIKDRLLTDFLGGENDRVEFWRRYLIPMRRVDRTRDRAVAFLYFDGWTAVQFVNPGRATFLFREHAVRGWIRMSELDIYRMALDYRARRPDLFLDSYEHRGHSATWQAEAIRVVNAVLGQLNARGHSKGGD